MPRSWRALARITLHSWVKNNGPVLDLQLYFRLNFNKTKKRNPQSTKKQQELLSKDPARRSAVQPTNSQLTNNPNHHHTSQHSNHHNTSQHPHMRHPAHTSSQPTTVCSRCTGSTAVHCRSTAGLYLLRSRYPMCGPGFNKIRPNCCRNDLC